MKTRTTLPVRLLCLALVAVMAFGLCACPAVDPPAGGSSTTTTGSGIPGGNPGEVTDATYADGAAVEGAGATIPEDAFALTPHAADEANAKEADTITALFRGKTPDAGATYIIKNLSEISASGRPYDGNGAIFVALNGIVIDGAADFTLRNMTIIGPVTVKNSQSVNFESVDIQNPNGVALTVENTVTGVLLEDCRISGQTAMANAADGTAVLKSVIVSVTTGIVDTAKTGTVIMNCMFSGEGTALSTASSEAQIRQNTFTMGATATAIRVTGTPLNVLIALNDITGAQKSMLLEGATNISVILNRAITVVANSNTSIYICDNSLGGRLRSEGNNYFLADGNTFPEGDGLDHTALQANNQNTNGDTITDVDARLEVGANEDLLPHTNKELFVGMEKKDFVSVGNVDTGKRVNEYIQEEAKNSPYVIIAPGLYRVYADTFLNAAHSNTTVYGYGAQMERAYTDSMSLGRMFAFSDRADKITLKGLTIGFERQSCGQVYVLDKYKKAGYGNVLLVVTGAGMDNEFGNTTPKLYDVTGMGAQREGTFYAYCDTGFNTIKKLDNGLMEMSVSDSVYEMILEGDILTCRSQQAGTTLTVNNSTDITFKDMVIYGNSGGFASVEGANRTATTYYRLHNTTKSGPIIDEATYNWYKALEEEYGVSTEVYIDELGRFRGSLPHIGSIDATHTTGCAQGSVVVSCIFENMCDDATNQNHVHARVDELIDNGDGTTTIVYKGNYSEYSYGQYGSGAGGYCQPFVVGDRVYVYTSAGQLVCDTPALSVTEKYMVNENGKMVQKTVFCEQKWERYVSKYGNTGKGNFYTNFFYVTVKTEDVNFDAVEGFDMTLNTWQNKDKVLIDNMSMASNGFIFDNVLSQNIRSRGLLIKASEGQIINCTFNNIGMACAAILYEIYWGESGVSENLLVARNVMDHTGYFTKYTSGNQDRYSPIAIEGLGSRVDEDFLLYKNIQIIDNVIRNRTTKYAVYINSACDITIKGNDFGDREGGEDPENPTLAIHINGAMNIEISDNKYSSLDLSIEEKIIAEHNKNVFGTDVEYNGEKIIPDNE